MNSDFNNQTFDSIISAANAFTTPFITNISPGTSDTYSYDVYTSEQMQETFNINDIVWKYGGPILGYNLSTQNFTAATDCSGFIARILNAVTLPNQQSSIYKNLVVKNGTVQQYATPQHPQPFPSAEDYADLFVNSTDSKWSTISFNSASSKTSSGSIEHALPGDILAYGLPAGSSDTGHVMIINKVFPLQRGQLNAELWGSDLTEFTEPNLTFFSVNVYDSSNVAHYHDLRGNAAAGTTGVGLGKILIIGDSMGTPLAFMFNVHYKLLTTYPIKTDIPSSQITQIDSLAIGRATNQ